MSMIIKTSIIRPRNFRSVQRNPTAAIAPVLRSFKPAPLIRVLTPGRRHFREGTPEVRMRVSRGILSLTVALAIAPVGIGFAHGGGSMGGGGPTGSAAGSRSSSPENAAKAAYNSGVRSIKEAKEYESDAAKASNPQKSAKALDKAHQYYSKALEQFIDAVSQQPKMYEAWNYIGFANRHLGSYDAALSAYAKALELNPAYPEAIEYRGEAYLGLNKIDEAKEAY